MLSLFLPERRSERGPLDDFWYAPIGRSTTAGVRVDHNTALNYSAVACATRIISETSAQLPLKIYEYTSNGGRKEASDFSLYSVLHDAPNQEMGSMAFRDSRTQQQVNSGNAYAEIERAGGQIINLWPIHSARVEPYREVDGSLWYAVRNNDGSKTLFPSRDILHIPGALSEDGIVGRGIVTLARESIGFGLATERHGSAFFGNGARPSGILKHPDKLSNEARANLRNEWKMIHGGPDNAGEIAILWEGMEYAQLSMSNEDSQFLQTRQHNVTEIARWYRLPPHMLADLVRSTNNNIEHQGLEFVVYSLMPWLKRWEEALTLRLLTREERKRYFIEHNVSGLLRGDIKTRYEAYKTGIGNGWLTVNDICRMENLNPIGPAGDEHFMPLNMTTIERLAEGEPEPAEAPAQLPNDDAQEAADFIAQQLGLTQTSIASGFDAIAAKLDGEARRANQDASRDVLLDAMRRMTHREATEATDAASKPAKFLAWIDEFYAKHERTVREAVSAPVRCCQAAGFSVTVEAVVGQHIQRSREALLELSGKANASNLAEMVAVEMQAWITSRANDYVNELLAKE